MRTARLASTAFWLFLAVLAALVVATRLAPAVAGVSAVGVTGQSMTGTYDMGSLVYIDPDATPAIGDVVTFANNGHLWTHRIIARVRGTDLASLATFEKNWWQTQGDAVGHEDPFPLNPKDIRGVAVGSIPYIGYADIYMQQPAAWLFVILVGALLMSLSREDRIKRRLQEHVTPYQPKNRTEARLIAHFPTYSHFG